MTYYIVCIETPIRHKENDVFLIEISDDFKKTKWECLCFHKGKIPLTINSLIQARFLLGYIKIIYPLSPSQRFIIETTV